MATPDMITAPRRPTNATTYTFQLHPELWQAWKQSDTTDTPVYQRVRHALADDAGLQIPARDPDAAPVSIDVDPETWYAWADTVPRSQSLSAHLNSVLEADLRAAEHDGDDVDIEPKTVGLFATRIKIRGRAAIAELNSDDPDREKTIEKLEELMDMATVLED